MLSLAKPNKRGIYPEITDEVQQRIFSYDKADVVGLAAIHLLTGELPPREHEIWLADQVINRRGVRIDLDYVHDAKQIAEVTEAALFAEFAELTMGAIAKKGVPQGLRPTQVKKTREWLKSQGCTLETLQEETIIEALDERVLPDNIRRVLELRQIAASTSLSKLDAMLTCVCDDGRVRGMFEYHGAGPGRWSGKLVQLQNLPRPTVTIDPEEVEEVVAAVKTGDPEALTRWGKPRDVLMSSLRFALIPGEALHFGVGDWTMIEACILLALAGQRDKCQLVEDGVDLYRDAAAVIHGLDHAAFMAIPKGELTAEQERWRQDGKVTILGCQYGMGSDQYRKRYCRHLSPEEGVNFAEEVIKRYREEWAPRIPRLWYDLNDCVIAAIRHPGKTVRAHCEIKYKLEQGPAFPRLVCTLLNGKRIYYQNARLNGKANKYGHPFWSYDAYKNKRWIEISPSAGHLAENIAQALARELLADTILECEARGYPVVMHVHDEVVVESADITAEALKEIMETKPQWAINIGVPIKAECWVGSRYRK
jgi:DNA polymerase